MESRIRKLEWSNRVLFVGVLLLSAPWVLGAASKVMEVETLKVTNGKFDTIGTGMILMLDKDGKTRGGILATKDITMWKFKDENGKDRLTLGISGGVPFIKFKDADGKLIAEISEKDGKVQFKK